ncbi:MAG: energy transducer TonB [Myxococcota bacterium]
MSTRIAPVLLTTSLMFPAALHAQAPRVVGEGDEAPAAEAPAEAPADDPKVAGAREFLTEVMGLVEKGKWKDLKARIHPYTLKVMEERKTRTKRDDHNLAFWTHVKEWKIQKWEIAGVEPGPRGTAIATTREDHFLIEEKGVEEGKENEWLLLKANPDGKGERWLLLDRRNGTGNFTQTAIEKGFEDALPKAVAGESDVAPKSPMAAYQAKLEKAVRAKLKVPEEIPENQLKVMTCSVKIMIDEGGSVLSRTVVRPSGNPAYDKAIIRAVDAAQPLPAPDNPVVEDAKKGVTVEFKARP